MRIVNPGMDIRLWLVYMEDGQVVSGLDHLKVKVDGDDSSSLLSETTLTEEGSTGFYYYDWTTSSAFLGKEAIALFTRSGEILCSEGYYFDIIEDMDGIAT